MIVYEPNKNWLRDIGHLTKSWTMQKIGSAVIVVGLICLAVCAFIIEMDYMDRLVVDASVFSFLGIVLSILLVFRTNTAYDRWWEGRKQWGALVNNCRNMAVYGHGMLPAGDLESRKQLAVYISNFCIAFKEHLRQGTKLDELIHINEEQRKEYEGKDHIPNHISLQIFQFFQSRYKDGILDEGDIINVKPQHQSLLDILGACERIKKTPIPFSYNVFLRLFIGAYALMLPFGLVATFGYFAVPLVMIIFFAMIGVELMAEEIEDPFGLDCNDLPTGTIAHTIKNNVFEILTKKHPIKHEQHTYEKIF